MQSDIDSAKGLPLGLLRRYLTARGWRALSSTGAFDLFASSEVGFADVEIILPKNSSVPDLGKRIAFAIRSLSELEGRDYEQIDADIRSIGFDVIRSRLPDDLVSNDSVHLEIAAEFITSTRRLLAAAATTEINPDRFFGRALKEAQEYAELCRFGHTFRGSFGFTVESPITLNREPTLDGVDQVPPFERRVVQRIARGLQNVMAASDEDNPRRLIEGYQTGFSANMCEDFLDIVEATAGRGIAFEFAFSPEWRVPPDIGPVHTFDVGPRQIEVMREAAKELRDQDFDRPRIVIGRIVRLESRSDPSDLLHPVGAREVVVQWLHSDFGDISVRVTLPPDKYLLAVDAHRNGQRISVTGKIERLGRLWKLLQPRDVAVLT